MAVEIPKGVDVTIDGQAVRVKGPKGELARDFPKQMAIGMEDGKIRVSLFCVWSLVTLL